MLEIFIIVSVLLLCSYMFFRGRRKYELPPEPCGLPFCGNSCQVDLDRLQHSLTDLSREYGPVFKVKLFGAKILTLTSSYAMRRAFDLDPTDAHLNDRSKNSTNDIFYNRKHMGCANLTKETIGLRQFHIQGIQKHFDGGTLFEFYYRSEVNKLFLNLASKHGANTNPHNFLKTFLKNLCSILLVGDTFPEEDDEVDILWEFIDSLYDMIDPSIDGLLKRFPFLKNFPGKYGNAYRRTIAARDRVAKRYFDDIKATYRHGKIRGLVDVCLKTQKEETDKSGSTWLTDEYIKGLIYDTLAAGMTELLKTLRLFILLMCHHPHIQTKLQTEVDSVIGSERFPSADNHKWMPYTDATILEILRYGSQTPLAIPHKCNKDVILDGYLIEKGSVIIPNLWGIHHDPDIWGDPWEFRPERFLDEDGTLLPADHKLMQNVIPFGVGKRACPGQDFARSRTFICITTLLQRMSFVPPEGEPLPSADPRSYGKQYPMNEPVYRCIVVPREDAII